MIPPLQHQLPDPPRPPKPPAIHSGRLNKPLVADMIFTIGLDATPEPTTAASDETACPRSVVGHPPL